MADDIRELTLRVKVDGNELKVLGADFRKTGDQAKGAGEEAATAGQKARAFFRRLPGAAKAAAGLFLIHQAFVKIKQVMTAGIRIAADYQASFSKIIGLVGVSREEAARWQQDLKDLPPLGKDLRELSDALFFISSAGYKGSEGMDVLLSSAKASTAGLGETKDVAKLVTGAVTAYGKSNLSAAAATDILTVAVREGKAEAADYATSLGPVLADAERLEIKFSEVAGAVASLSRLEITPDRAVTQLRALLKGLLRPTREATDLLAEVRKEGSGVGLTFADIRAEIREKGLLAGLDKLNRAAGVLGEEKFARLFESNEAFSFVVALLGKNADTTRKILDATADSAGATDAAFEEAKTTFNFWYKELKGRLGVALLNLGTTILPAVTLGTKELIRFVNLLIDAGGAVKDVFVGAFEFVRDTVEAAGEFLGGLSRNAGPGGPPELTALVSHGAGVEELRKRIGAVSEEVEAIPFAEQTARVEELGREIQQLELRRRSGFLGADGVARITELKNELDAVTGSLEEARKAGEKLDAELDDAGKGTAAMIVEASEEYRKALKELEALREGLGDVASLSYDELVRQRQAALGIMKDLPAGEREALRGIFSDFFISDFSRKLSKGFADGFEREIDAYFRGENGLLDTLRAGGDVIAASISDAVAKSVAGRFTKRVQGAFNAAFDRSLAGLGQAFPGLRGLGDRAKSFLNGPGGTALAGGATLFSGIQQGNALVGGLGGAALGAQIGSFIAPGIGTAVGAVLGGVGGLIASLLGRPKTPKIQFEQRGDIPLGTGATGAYSFYYKGRNAGLSEDEVTGLFREITNLAERQADEIENVLRGLPSEVYGEVVGLLKDVNLPSGTLDFGKKNKDAGALRQSFEDFIRGVPGAVVEAFDETLLEALRGVGFGAGYGVTIDGQGVPALDHFVRSRIARIDGLSGDARTREAEELLGIVSAAAEAGRILAGGLSELHDIGNLSRELEVDGLADMNRALKELQNSTRINPENLARWKELRSLMISVPTQLSRMLSTTAGQIEQLSEFASTRTDTSAALREGAASIGNLLEAGDLTLYERQGLLSQQFSQIQRLAALERGRYEQEVERAQELKSLYEQVGGLAESIQDTVVSLATGGDSPLSAAEKVGRLLDEQRRLEARLAHASGADRVAALDQLRGFFPQLARAGGELGGAGQRALFFAAESQLQGLLGDQIFKTQEQRLADIGNTLEREFQLSRETQAMLDNHLSRQNDLQEDMLSEMRDINRKVTGSSHGGVS